MGVIEYPDGKTLTTHEGDRYEATQYLVLDVEGREIRLRPGDMLTIIRDHNPLKIKKIEPYRKIMQLP